MLKLKKSVFISLALLNLNIFAECKQNIHLTFDDGPLLGKTNKVFDTLEKYKIKATFFVNSHYINSGQAKLTSDEKRLYSPVMGAINSIEENKKRRWLLKRMKEAGHKIGSHGFGHYSFKDGDKAYPTGNLKGSYQKKRNIELSTQVLKGFMTEPYAFRLPYGKPFRGANTKMRNQVNDILSSQYDMNVGWTTDSRDWEYDGKYNRAKGSNKELIKKQFVKDVADKMCETGGITVFHDIKNITGDALGDLIKEVKRRGGGFVDFSQASQDPSQDGALETLTEKGAQYCSSAQENLSPSKKVDELAYDGIGEIIANLYGSVVEEYASQKQAQQALEAISFGSKCISQQNKKARFEIRCKKKVVYVSELNPDNYPKHISSYQNKEYAMEAVQKEIDKGRDCEIIPIINSQGIPFNRVACRR